jgi:proteic killer suppression protein
MKALPRQLQRNALRTLTQLDTADHLEDLRVPPGNRLEALGGDREGQRATGRQR